MDRRSNGRTETVNVISAYLRISFFSYMTLRHLEIGSQVFEATYVPVFSVRNAQEHTGRNERLKMRTLHCLETLGSDFRMVQCGIPGE
jgi:hypothetical protein